MTGDVLHPKGRRAYARKGFRVFALPVVTAGLAGALSIGFVVMSGTPGEAAQYSASGHHAKKSASSCSAYKAGHNGVIRTFCTGHATATVTDAGVTTVIKGGTCGKSGSYFTVNVGVVTEPGSKGAKPNYFGLDVPPTATTFTNAILSYDVGGVGGYATSNSGTVASNHKNGAFSGTDPQGAPVSGSFTC